MRGVDLTPIRPKRHRVLSQDEQDRIRSLAALPSLLGITITMWGGYPAIHRKQNGRFIFVMVHRLVMEHKLGRFLLPEENVHHVDHDSRNPSPDNLVLYANRSEHMKAEHSSPSGLSAINAAKTHCPAGHELGPKRWRGNRRYCPICRRAYIREYMRKRRAKMLTANNSSTVTLPSQIAEGASQTTSPPLDTASNVHPGTPTP